MGRVGYWVAVLIVAAGINLLLPSRSHALTPDRDIAQYAHRSWKIDDGYFGSNPNSLAQDNDGYLWIGTFHGLYRYDGDRFLRWNPPAGTHLPGSTIYSLLADRDGSLWIGTDAGLAHLSGGHLKNYFENEGLISGFYQAPDGTVWFGIHSFSKNESKVLCGIRNSSVHCYGDKDGLEQQIMAAAIFARDDAGYLWMGTPTSVVRWKPSSPPLVLSPKALESNSGQMGAKALIFDRDGSLLVGITGNRSGQGLQRLRGDKWSTVSAPNFDGSKLPVLVLFRDAHDALWIGTRSDGLYRLYQGKAEHFSSRDGLSGDTVWAITEDREGTLWVATDKGLDSFHDTPVLALSLTEFGVPELDNIVTTRDGTLWVGGMGGLFTLNKGVPGVTSRGGNLGHKQVTAIFEDRRGRMWIGLDDTLNLLTGNSFHPAHAMGGRLGMIVSIAEDKDGKLWAVSLGPPRHIVRIDPDTLLATLVPDMPQVSKIASDRHGGFWLGLNNGDLDHLDNGKLVAYPMHHGPNTRIQQLTVTERGDVIAAAPFGLLQIRDGKVSILDDHGGLPCSNINNFVFDLEGNLWLYSECGLVQLRKSEFQAWQQQPDLKVRTRLFDWMDGFRVFFPPFEGAARSGDGRLWFNNEFALQVVDPTHITTNLIRPPVHIEAVVADRVSYPPLDGLRLPKLTRDLEIDYTGLSFVAPQKVMFRYMLTGVDQAWQNVDTRRQAFYNNLKPGKYSFRVIACNNDGLWNDEGAHLDFVIAPAWYQTIWFRLLCVAAFLAFLWGLYRLRLQQLARQYGMRLEERVSERTRIARELHDTLLQSFQGLLLHLQVVSDLLPMRPQESKQKLESAVDQAAEAIREGRDAVQDLRSSVTVTNDVALALNVLGQELAVDETNHSASAPVFHVEVEGAPRDLHPVARDEVYRIAGEALRNAFRHADAQHVEIEIRYDERRLRLRLRDDGKGIDPKLLTDDGDEGHYGLRGMRERAKLLGGKLTVWSERGSGTEVELIIPAAQAYMPSPGQPRSWLPERFFRKDKERKR